MAALAGRRLTAMAASLQGEARRRTGPAAGALTGAGMGAAGTGSAPAAGAPGLPGPGRRVLAGPGGPARTGARATPGRLAGRWAAAPAAPIARTSAARCSGAGRPPGP